MNAFESGSRRCIPAVLVYGFRFCANGHREFLMLERIHKEDFHKDRFNGLGGKCEADESFLQTAAREFQEESGFHLPDDLLKHVGLIQFPNFKPHKSEDWIVSIFTADVSNCPWVHSDLQPTPEGVLHWIPEEKILKLPLWPGDLRFLPWVLQGKHFTGTLWYSQGKVIQEEWL